MSVILYQDEKFLRIYQSLHLRGSRIAHIWHYPKGWDKPDGMDETLKNFVNDLRRANTITWNRQYEDDQYPLDILPSRRATSYSDNFELLKSLRGLRYNLIANDGSETNLLGCMEKLDRLIEFVAFEIIDKLPEWERANTW